MRLQRYRGQAQAWRSIRKGESKKKTEKVSTDNASIVITIVIENLNFLFKNSLIC